MQTTVTVQEASAMGLSTSYDRLSAQDVANMLYAWQHTPNSWQHATGFATNGNGSWWVLTGTTGGTNTTGTFNLYNHLNTHFTSPTQPLTALNAHAILTALGAHPQPPTAAPTATPTAAPTAAPTVGILTNNTTGKQYAKLQVGREVGIGRSSKRSDIVVSESGNVSRLHAHLMYTHEGVIRVKDAESANGTYVDGVRVRGGWCVVPAGSILTLGDVDIKVM